MATKLKEIFDAKLVRSLADALRSAHPELRHRAFAEGCIAKLNRLELIQRVRHIADVMHDHLPRPFPAAAEVIVSSLGPELDRSDEFGMAPLRYMPHVFFVQKYGLDHFEAAMRAQYELTKRYSAESSIRAFLVRYPKETYARLQEWARDENVHVRRLVSEGTRPRLPWAPRLRAFQEDPKPVLSLLELLKDDPERYVQRSVANNLNDISKDHPDLAVEVCRRWLVDAPAERAWIVRHALRSLVKSVHRGALVTLGVGKTPRVKIGRASVSPADIKLGSVVRFSFEIRNTGKSKENLLVDYRVHFVKANGATRAKVFKLRELVLEAGDRATLSRSISFRRMTTRQHYPGRHRIEALVNGMAYPLGEFAVRDR